ncbi:protein-export chaperone SecB [uncultured Acetobacteroides sp.]|uniref:protein-export chaperone SecB n=1 Tax=uncultured Acetobacteroides sp. TaxID=1760811 RepID=UPI0029F5054B|nr:protein-export chaperone SecB [uncultured Acetobacteroides sp.]
MENVKKSAFRFDDFFINEVQTKIENRHFDGEIELGMNLSGSSVLRNSKSQLELTIILRVEAEDYFNISISTVGLFTTSFVEGDEKFESYLYTNAPAILFPYIRAAIASITAQCGIPPVRLPLMNLTEFGQKLKESRTIEE